MRQAHGAGRKPEVKCGVAGLLADYILPAEERRACGACLCVGRVPMSGATMKAGVSFMAVVSAYARRVWRRSSYEKYIARKACCAE